MTESDRGCDLILSEHELGAPTVASLIPDAELLSCTFLHHWSWTAQRISPFAHLLTDTVCHTIYWIFKNPLTLQRSTLEKRDHVRFRRRLRVLFAR